MAPKRPSKSLKSAAKTPTPRSFTCPACGGMVAVRALGHSITAVCPYCSTVVDIANEHYRILQKAAENTRETLLEIGMRGKFSGIMWEVIGYMEKSDGSFLGAGRYFWDEYLLYNPFHGFRFLVQAGGHWSLMQVIKHDYAGEGEYGGRKYQLFNDGDAIVRYVKGEFYWQVKVGDTTKVADYISPPYQLSTEETGDEMTVALGVYFEPWEVAECFNLTAKMPRREGVGMNQPPLYHGRYRQIWCIFIAAFVAALLVQVFTLADAANEKMFGDTAVVHPNMRGKSLITKEFTLPKEGNVEIKTIAGLDNNWVEYSHSLVNEKDNLSYDVLQAAEYYKGRDSDGPWAEGKNYASSYFSKVKPGTYKVVTEVDSDLLQKQRDLQFSLTVTRDVPNTSNIKIALFLLLIYPLYTLLRRSSFEKKRWSNSDYAPAIYRSE